MEEISGKRYRLVTSENLDEYLVFMDVGYFQRLTGRTLSPVSCLVKNDDGTYSFTMEVELLRQSHTITFRPDEEFIEERPDKTKVTSKVVFEGNKMIHTQLEENGRKSKFVREFTADTLTVITTAEGWDGQCIRVYKLVETKDNETYEPPSLLY